MFWSPVDMTSTLDYFQYRIWGQKGDPRHTQPTDMTVQVLLSLGFGSLAPKKGAEYMPTLKSRMGLPWWHTG